jgi:peptide/nickel transport system permease protein
MGAKNWRIMTREVLPNVIPAMLSIALLGVGIAIVAEGGLSLFGVGVQLPTPSWGNIIAEGRGQMRRAPHIVVFTSIVLFITVLALNYLGDVISQRFSVRGSVL